MAATDPDKQRGMYPKYRVEKLNGKPVGPCFVLEFKDPHARAAIRAYAESCQDEYPQLAADLLKALDPYRGDPGRRWPT